MLKFKVNTKRSLLWDLRGKSSLAKSIMPQQVTYMRPQTFLCTILSHTSCHPPYLWGPLSWPWELHLHMFSCRTKLAMLLCLKYLGSTSLAKRPWSNTWKLVPFCKGDKDTGKFRGASLTTRGAQEESYSRASLVLWIATLKLRRVRTALNDRCAAFSSGTVRPLWLQVWSFSAFCHCLVESLGCEKETTDFCAQIAGR